MLLSPAGCSTTRTPRRPIVRTTVRTTAVTTSVTTPTSGRAFSVRSLLGVTVTLVTKQSFANLQDKVNETLFRQHNMSVSKHCLASRWSVTARFNSSVPGGGRISLPHPVGTFDKQIQNAGDIWASSSRGIVTNTLDIQSKGGIFI